tara:strand:+ start:231 stop:680 length:450 start_codon:yes stop_codon:yes gene_type:complete
MMNPHNPDYWVSFNRDYLAGMLYSHAYPTIRVAKSADSALGYRVTLMITFKLKGRVDSHHQQVVLAGMNRSLYQHEIESTLNTKGLCISKKDSIGKTLDLIFRRDFHPPQSRKWRDFTTCYELVEQGEHLTQDGLDTIVEIVDGCPSYL